MLLICTNVLNANQMSDSLLSFPDVNSPSVEESGSARMNCFITEQNNIIICYFAWPDQTKKLSCLGGGGQTGSLYFFSLIR